MKTSLKMFFALTTIAVLSGGLLAGLDSVTAPHIEAYRIMELKASVAEVLPPYDYYEELTQGSITLYLGKKKEVSEPVGVAFRLVGSGFQGKIAMMIGMKPDFKTMTGMRILEQVETPGLGTKIVEDPSNKENPYWFPDQFKGLTISPQIEVIKNLKPSNPTEIQAISGATISSKAVVRILNEQIAIARKIYQGRSNKP